MPRLLDSGCQLLLYLYWKTITRTFLGRGTMSLGNNSKSIVELDQIQHAEETQYQLRPRDAIRQPRRYASQDQLQANTDIIYTRLCPLHFC